MKKKPSEIFEGKNSSLRKTYEEAIKSTVNIRQAKNCTGYLIEITDGITDPMYAVTREELEQIVLYGGIILKTT